MRENAPPRSSRAPRKSGAPLAVRPLSDLEFSRFQALIERETGIHLIREKRDLLMGRLGKRVRELGLGSYAEYYRLVCEEAAGRDERQRMIDLVSTNETRFFREPQHFEFVARTLERWRAESDAGRRPKRVRAWSAACSTGEEPYSLAMELRARLPEAEGWQIEVVASDVSTRVLDRARDAVYPAERADEVPLEYRRSYMLRGVASQQGRVKVAPELRRIVQFVQVNLNDEAYPVAGPFDLIFCRNVFIYFETTTKTRAVERLLRHLAPTGYLFLGRSETLHGVTTRVRNVEPSIYAFAEEAPASRDPSTSRRRAGGKR
jgi:chemotaxis protein methyltransferase CheR